MGKMIIMSALLILLTNNSVATTPSANAASLAEYFSKLEYVQPNEKNLQSVNQPQMSMQINSPITLSSITVNFYLETSDSGACLQDPSASITLNGPVVLSAGTYTSSDQSNFELCSRFVNGCQGELDNEISGVKFLYRKSDGGIIEGNCSADTPGGIAFGYYSPIWSMNPSGACTSNGDCGFSGAWTDVLN